MFETNQMVLVYIVGIFSAYNSKIHRQRVLFCNT